MVTQEESPKFGRSEERGRDKVKWARRAQEEEYRDSDKENEFNYYPVRKASVKIKLSNQPVNLITTESDEFI